MATSNISFDGTVRRLCCQYSPTNASQTTKASKRPFSSGRIATIARTGTDYENALPQLSGYDYPLHP